MRVSEVFALLDERKNHQQHKLKRIKTSLGTVIGAQDAAANYSLTLQTLTRTSPCATCIWLLHLLLNTIAQDGLVPVQLALVVFN